MSVVVPVAAVVGDDADVFSIPWCGQCGSSSVVVSELVVMFLLLCVFRWHELELSPF